MHQIKVANNEEGLWPFQDMALGLNRYRSTIVLFVCDEEGTKESYNTQIGSIVVD